MALARPIAAGQAAHYYDRDDYYTREATPSRWYGAGAAALGLAGAVRAADFRPLVHGRLPDGTTLHRGGSGGRRAGTDVEFSAPKSFSIQALVVGDTRLLAVHQRAVAVAREHLETLMATRVTQRHRTTVVTTGKAVIAQFEHTTSRAGDPNLHSHVVVLNCTQRADGQWRSLENTAIFQSQRLLYGIYLAELAHGVSAVT